MPTQKDMVTEGELKAFSAAFAQLWNENRLALVPMMSLLKEQQTNEYFAEVLQDVETSLRRGEILPDTFAQHPEVFSDAYVKAVRGTLAEFGAGKIDSLAGVFHQLAA